MTGDDILLQLWVSKVKVAVFELQLIVYLI